MSGTSGTSVLVCYLVVGLYEHCGGQRLWQAVRPAAVATAGESAVCAGWHAGRRLCRWERRGREWLRAYAPTHKYRKLKHTESVLSHTHLTHIHSSSISNSSSQTDANQHKIRNPKPSLPLHPSPEPEHLKYTRTLHYI